jgi:dTDP-4-amino-4,6-dideoxygalactose transaminase
LQCLQGNDDLVLPHTLNDCKHVWHVFVVRTKLRAELQQKLADNGIQTLIHYPIPPHKQDAYKQMNQLSYPISEKIHAEVLSLPIGPHFLLEHGDFVIDIASKLLRQLS